MRRYYLLNKIRGNLGNMDLQEMLSKFEKMKKQNNGGYLVTCPVHGDKNPSLSIGMNEGGDRVLMHCHAGCNNKDILQAINLTEKDLYVENWNRGNGGNGKKLGDYIRGEFTTKHLQEHNTAFYIYHDPEGQPVMGVSRFNTKDNKKGFCQYRYLGCDKWTKGLDNTPPMLYNLPAIIQAIKAGETIFIVEGEKDCESLKEIGLIVTTSPMGAGKWKDAYSSYLQGARVVILPDNDRPGQDHASQILKSLQGIAREIKVLNLPDLQDKQDISDWLQLGMGDKDKLLELTERTAPAERVLPAIQDKNKKSLDSYLLKDEDLQLPDYWLIDNILSPFTLNTIFSAAGAGKSLFVLLLSCYLLENNKIDTVIYLDKDNSKKTLQNRNLLAIKNKFGQNRFKYIPACNMDNEVMNILLGELKERKHGHCLIMVDTIRNFLKGDANSDKDSIAFMDTMKQIREYDNTVIMLHHVNKMKQIKNNTSIVDYSDVVYRLEANKDKENNKLFFNISLGDNPKDRIGVKEEFSGILDYKSYTLTLQDQGLNPEDMDFTNYVKSLLQNGEMNQSQIWENVKKELEMNFKGEVVAKLKRYNGVLWESKKSKYCNTCTYNLLPEEKFKTILSYILFNDINNNNNNINNFRQLDNPTITPFIEGDTIRQLDNPTITPFIEESIENTGLSNVNDMKNVGNGVNTGLSNCKTKNNKKNGFVGGCLGCPGDIRRLKNEENLNPVSENSFSLTSDKKVICMNCKNFDCINSIKQIGRCLKGFNNGYNGCVEHTCNAYSPAVQEVVSAN